MAAKDGNDKDTAEQKLIRDLAALLNETGLSEIEIEKSGLKVRVARTLHIAGTAMVGHAATAGAPTAAVAAAPSDPAKHPGAVKSPMVGTAYRSAEPGAATFCEVGSKVTQGDTVLIIEAMKTMNQIAAPRSGTVTAIFFENSHPVEYGEVLIIIE